MRSSLKLNSETVEVAQMSKIIPLAAAIGILVAASSTADARGGASRLAPGHSFLAHGSVAGHPGASGYPPGHFRQSFGSLRRHPGASGYAPGHRFVHH